MSISISPPSHKTRIKKKQTSFLNGLNCIITKTNNNKVQKGERKGIKWCLSQRRSEQLWLMSHSHLYTAQNIDSRFRWAAVCSRLKSASQLGSGIRVWSAGCQWCHSGRWKRPVPRPTGYCPSGFPDHTTSQECSPPVNCNRGHPPLSVLPLHDIDVVERTSRAPIQSAFPAWTSAR